MGTEMSMWIKSKIKTQVSTESGDDLTWEITSDDSRLIGWVLRSEDANIAVAAPELLATLKGILTYVEDGNVVELRPCGFVDEVRAAIAKAESR